MKRKLRNSSFPVEYHRNKSESKKNIVVVSKYSCLRCDLRPPYKSIWRTHGIRYRQLLVFKIHVMERVGSWTFPPKCHWVKNPKLQFIWTKNFKVWGGSHWRHKYDKYFHSEFHQKQLTNIFIPWIYPPPTNITTRTFTFLDNVAALVSFITGFGVGPDRRRRSLSPMWDWDSKLPFTIDGQATLQKRLRAACNFCEADGILLPLHNANPVQAWSQKKLQLRIRESERTICWWMREPAVLWPLAYWAG